MTMSSIATSTGIDRGLLAAAALCGLTGVLAGTFGAHGLKGRIAGNLLEDFEIGVRYQLIHAVAMLAVVALCAMTPHNRLLRIAGWCMVIGIIVFSGSLYVLALTGETRLGMVTPIGGLSFMLAWLLLAIGALRMADHQTGSAQPGA